MKDEESGCAGATIGLVSVARAANFWRIPMIKNHFGSIVIAAAIIIAALIYARVNRYEPVRGGAGVMTFDRWSGGMQ